MPKLVTQDQVTRLLAARSQPNAADTFKGYIINEATIRETVVHKLPNGRSKTNEVRRELDILSETIPPILTKYLSELKERENGWRLAAAGESVIELSMELKLYKRPASAH